MGPASISGPSLAATVLVDLIKRVDVLQLDGHHRLLDGHHRLAALRLIDSQSVSTATRAEMRLRGDMPARGDALAHAKGAWTYICDPREPCLNLTDCALSPHCQAQPIAWARYRAQVWRPTSWSRPLPSLRIYRIWSAIQSSTTRSNGNCVATCQPEVTLARTRTGAWTRVCDPREPCLILTDRDLSPHCQAQPIVYMWARHRAQLWRPTSWIRPLSTS